MLFQDSTEKTVLVSIHSLSFRVRSQWRLDTGKKIFNAKICDDSFWQDVKNGRIAFAGGERLTVRLKSTSRPQPDGKVKTDHEVVEVLGCEKGFRQSLLFSRGFRAGRRRPLWRGLVER